MTQLLVTLHHVQQQYPYLPIVLFVFALVIALGSFYNPKQSTRYVGFGIAVALVLCFAFCL